MGGIRYLLCLRWGWWVFCLLIFFMESYIFSVFEGGILVVFIVFVVGFFKTWTWFVFKIQLTQQCMTFKFFYC